MEMSIRQARRAKDITQKEMAESLKIHVQTYQRIEKYPETATIAQARAIADRLGMSYNDLIFARNSTKSRICKKALNEKET